MPSAVHMGLEAFAFVFLAPCILSLARTPRHSSLNLFVGQSSFALGMLPSPSALTSIPLISNQPHLGSSWSTPAPLTSVLPIIPSTSLALPSPWPPVSSHCSPSMGYALSPSSKPFPQKLVDKVRSGQFIEMRELLIDNIDLMQRLDSFGTQFSLPSLPGSLKPRLREITSLVPWLHCFLAYVALRTSDPNTEHMLAYGRLIIQVAQQHQGLGWLEYDRVFRQQAAIRPSLEWNKLHTDIQGATILSQAPGRASMCPYCFEYDHKPEQCALLYFQSPSAPAVSSSYRPPARRVQVSKSPETLLRICASWNHGRCSFPNNCSFRHVCAICQNRHMARQCPDLPEGSPYRKTQHFSNRALQPPTCASNS